MCDEVAPVVVQAIVSANTECAQSSSIWIWMRTKGVFFFLIYARNHAPWTKYVIVLNNPSKYCQVLKHSCNLMVKISINKEMRSTWQPWKRLHRLDHPRQLPRYWKVSPQSFVPLLSLSTSGVIASKRRMSQWDEQLLTSPQTTLLTYLRRRSA